MSIEYILSTGGGAIIAYETYMIAFEVLVRHTIVDIVLDLSNINIIGV